MSQYGQIQAGIPSMPDIETLTGNIGGPVGPDAAGNVDIIGDAATITVSGDPLTNTLTISTAGEVAIQFDEDTGSAIPVGGIIDIISKIGTDVNDATFRNLRTEGNSNIVEISLNNSLSFPNTNAAGTRGLYSLGNNRFMHNFGTGNTFLGENAGNLTMTAQGITGIGQNALAANTTGLNTAIGWRALRNCTSGSTNTAVGYQSLMSITTGTGDSNTCVGHNSGMSLTTGPQNTAIGDRALEACVTGRDNTCVGHRSLLVCTGSNNTVIGQDAGGSITTGSYNTILGDGSAVTTLTTGSSNIFIGQGVVASTAAESNTIRIGRFGATGTGNGEQNLTFLTGNVRKPTTAKFSAYPSGNILNITGDGTVYVIIFNTENFDIGGNYNTGTGIFTAPIDGHYRFTAGINVTGLVAGNTSGQVRFDINGVDYLFGNYNWGAMASSSGSVHADGSCLVFMSATQQAKVELAISGGALATDITGGNGVTYFMGELIG